MNALPSTSPTSPTSADAYFTARFGAPLPRGLREQAGQLPWPGFLAIYGQTPGLLRIGQWACLDGSRLGPQRTFQATISVGDRTSTCTAAASGPVAALTTMLYEQGIPVELLRFHQFDCRDETATLIRGSDGRRAAWAIGFSPDPTQSALDTVLTCANRLLTLTV